MTEAHQAQGQAVAAALFSINLARMLVAKEILTLDELRDVLEQAEEMLPAAGDTYGDAATSMLAIIARGACDPESPRRD